MKKIITLLGILSFITCSNSNTSIEFSNKVQTKLYLESGNYNLLEKLEKNQPPKSIVNQIYINGNSIIVFSEANHSISGETTIIQDGFSDYGICKQFQIHQSKAYIISFKSQHPNTITYKLNRISN